MFTPYGFIKNLQQIHVRDSHMKFTGKNKVGNTTWAKLCSLIGQKWQNSFQYTHAENLFANISQAGEQASQHLASSLPFSHFYILSSLLGCYYSGTSCSFHFGQMFNGFLTSTYFWFLLKSGTTNFMYHGKTFRRQVQASQLVRFAYCEILIIIAFRIWTF